MTLFNEKIIQVNGGFEHTIYLLINIKFNSQGNNTYGLLGQINIGNNLHSYINIEEIVERIKIIQITEGSRSSFLTNK